MRGKPKPRAGSGLNAWRSRQKPGAIMKPETFENIVEENEGKVGKARAEKMAGKAYWNAAEAKYKKRGGAKTDMGFNIIEDVK